jgi:formate dehydrogenase subunit delta
MSSAKMDKLVRMANQIGDYFKAMPDEEAVNGAADHLKRYWTPKMVGEIIAYVDGGHSGLNVTAARAVAALKRKSLV